MLLWAHRSQSSSSPSSWQEEEKREGSSKTKNIEVLSSHSDFPVWSDPKSQARNWAAGAQGERSRASPPEDEDHATNRFEPVDDVRRNSASSIRRRSPHGGVMIVEWKKTTEDRCVFTTTSLIKWTGETVSRSRDAGRTRGGMITSSVVTSLMLQTQSELMLSRYILTEGPALCSTMSVVQRRTHFIDFKHFVSLTRSILKLILRKKLGAGLKIWIMY